MSITQKTLGRSPTESSDRTILQRQQAAVDRTVSQLVISITSRLHERLASSISAKLAATDTTEKNKKTSIDVTPPVQPHSGDLVSVTSEDVHAANAVALAPEDTEISNPSSGNSSILNNWKGFPRSAPYYLPLISTLASMSRKNAVALLLQLMTEWLPQRHVLMSGGPSWDLTASSISSSTATPTSNSKEIAATSTTSSATSESFSGHAPFSASPMQLIEEGESSDSIFSFTTFTGRILNLKLSDQSQLDLVELVVLQVVADVLSLILSSLTSRVAAQTLEKLVQMSFTLVRSSQPRAIDGETWKILLAPVQAQWCVVLGYLGPLLMPIFTTFMTISFAKLPQESQLLLLEHMRLPLYRADESDVVAFVVASLPHLLSAREKSTSIRLVQLDTLDRWLMSCEMADGGPLFEKIKDVFKKLSELTAKNEDVEGATNKLIATILAHAPVSFRDKHVDGILSKTWLKYAWSSKKRDYLECILRILRGPFLDYHQPSGTVMFPTSAAPNTLPNALIYSPPATNSSTAIHVYRFGGSLASKLGIKPQIPPQAIPGMNPFSADDESPRVTHSTMFEQTWSKQATLSPYSQCGFTGDREDKMLQRLITINSGLFGQKNPLPRLAENVDLCSEIVVQIVAHHVKFGINSVLIPLVRGAVYNKMIALHALRKILDPTSGFLQTAYCFQQGYLSSNDQESQGQSIVATHVEEEDLKQLQGLLSELVIESLTFAQKQHKEQMKQDPYAAIPLQPHTQTCCADLEFLHELSTKQQLNTTSPSPIKGCFERIRQLVLAGSAQTWASRQKEVDQHHLLVQDSTLKWATSSGIPQGFSAADFKSIFDESNAFDKSTSSEKASTTKEGGNTAGSSLSVNVALNPTVASSLPWSGAPTSTKKWWGGSKRKAAQGEKYTLGDVARDAIGCLEFVLSNVHVLSPSEEFFIGNLLLHSDEEIAHACSLQLQQAILTRPKLRPVIMKGMCNLAVHLITDTWSVYAPNQPKSFAFSSGSLSVEPNNILAILSQVLILADLWNLACLLKSKSNTVNSSSGLSHTSASQDNSDVAPPPSVLDELDALSLLCLANNVPMARYIAWTLAQSLDSLRDTFGFPLKGVSWLVRQVEVPLLQRARFAFLKESVQGVDSKVVVKSDTMPLKLEAIAASSSSLWGHVLAELCHALVDNPLTYQIVVATRFVVSEFTNSWRNYISSSGVTFDLENPTHSDFAVLYKQVHIILFASLSVPLYTNSGIPTTLAIFTKPAGWIPSTNTFHSEQFTAIAPAATIVGASRKPLQPSASSFDPSNPPTVYPTTSTPPPASIDEVPIDARALRHADERLSQEVMQLQGPITNVFKSMMMENEALIDSLTFAASYTHWRSMLVVAANAWKWYTGLSTKTGVSKKRTKARPYIASIFRRMMRHQQQLQWAIRCPSPAWIHQIPPLTEFLPPSPGRRPPGSAIPPLPPIYLHLQSPAPSGPTARNPVIPSHEHMISIAAQPTTSLEDSPLGPLLLLLPRIFYAFLSDTPAIFANAHKSSSIDIGQYFIDHASILTRLIDAITDTPLVCCRTGALRQYLAPSQHRNAVLTVLVAGTSASLLQIAATAGGSLAKSSESSSNLSSSASSAVSNASLSASSSSIASSDSTAPGLNLGGLSAGIDRLSHDRSASLSVAKENLSPIVINWSEITDTLLSWAPVGKASSSRSTLDQEAINKALGRIKNAHRREERKIFAQYFLDNVGSAAMSALNRLAFCGLATPSAIVDRREIVSKVILDWVLAADSHHGWRFLRWLLASHMDVLLPTYVDRALGRDKFSSDTSSSSKDASSESLLFIHSIYDQFLEDAASAPPEDGISNSTRVFFDRHFQLQKERLRYEKSALKKEDKEFTATVISHAGPILFMVLLNLSHPIPLIRTRSFELLYRLGPIAFGLSHGMADYDLAKRFQDLRDAFISRMEGISRERAMEVVQLVAISCSGFTEDLFLEAFVRFKGLSSSNKSWALQFLSCWAENCKLQGDNPRAPVLNNDRDSTPWKHFSTDSLLYHLYTQLSSTLDLNDKSHGRAPLFSLWLGLCKVKDGINIPPVVEFLLAKSVVSKGDLSTCKMILLELYRSYPSETCQLLINKLTMATIAADIKAWSTPAQPNVSKVSIPQPNQISSTMLTGLGIGIAAFAVPGKTLSQATQQLQSNPPSTPTLGPKGAKIVRENSTSSVPSTQAFEYVPVLDGVSATSAWAALSGKKSVNQKNSASSMIRESVVSILGDLLIEDIGTALPHLSVIFNYALLKFDPQVAHMMYCALVPIKTLLKETDRKRAQELARTNGVLDTLITLLKHNTFKMSWVCESSTTSTPASNASAPPPPPSAVPPSPASNVASWNTGYSYGSGANGVPTLMLKRQQSGNLHVASLAQAQEGLGPSILEWAASIKPGYLVSVFCQCASLLGETSTKADWANELIQWITQSVSAPTSDLLASTRAIELCKAVVEASAASKDMKNVNSEPSTPSDTGRNSSAGQSDEGLYQLDDSDWLHVPQAVISNLQATLLESLIYLERALRTSADPSWISTSSLRDKQQHQENLTVLRGRAEDLLSCLALMVPHIDKASILVDVLFMGISVLRLSPVGFSSFFEKGLLLIQKVVGENRFLEMDSQSKRLRKHLKAAATWDFPGLIILVLKSWYSQRTERLAGSLLTSLIDIPQINLIAMNLTPAAQGKLGKTTSTSDSPKWIHTVLIIAGLMPYIHYSISVLNSVKDEEFTSAVSDTCNSIASMITNTLSTLPVESASDIVRSTLQPVRALFASLASRASSYGGYYKNVNGASLFVESVFRNLIILQNIHPSLESTISDLLAHLLTDGPAKLSESILFVGTAVRLSAAPLLVEKPVMTASSAGINKFTTMAVNSIYEHMVDMQSDPSITEATFRIGTSVLSDVQARSSIFVVMNTLYAYPTGWPVAFSDIELEPRRSLDGSPDSSTSNSESLSTELDSLRSASITPKPLMIPPGPLNRTQQTLSKLELLQIGGLKTVIDALKASVLKARSGANSKVRRTKTSQNSPTVAVVPAGASSGNSTLTAAGKSPGTLRGKKPIKIIGDPKSAGHKDKSSKASDSGSSTGNAKGMTSSTSDLTLSTSKHKPTLSDGTSGTGPTFGNIQIHFERSPSGSSLRGSSPSIRKKSLLGDSGEWNGSEDDITSDIEEETLHNLTADDFEAFRNALLEDIQDNSSDEDDYDDDDDDDEDDGLREDFFKQFNLDGINLSAFIGDEPPNNSNNGGKANNSKAKASESSAAEPFKSDKTNLKRTNSSEAPNLEESGFDMNFNLDGFEADSIAQALLGLQKYDTMSDNSSADDEDQYTNNDEDPESSTNETKSRSNSKNSAPGDEDDQDDSKGKNTVGRRNKPTSSKLAPSTLTVTYDPDSEGESETPEEKAARLKKKKRLSADTGLSSSSKRAPFKKATTSSSSTKKVRPSSANNSAAEDMSDDGDTEASSPKGSHTRSQSVQVTPLSAVSSNRTSSPSNHSVSAKALVSNTARTHSAIQPSSSTNLPSSKPAPLDSKPSNSSITSTSSSSSSSSSSSGTTKPMSASRRLYGSSRGKSSADVSGAGMRAVIEDPKAISKFLNWMKHNNLDADVLNLVVAIKEFHTQKDEKRVASAKRLVDQYFKPKRGLSTLTENLRSQIYSSYQALEGKAPPANFFDEVETYCVEHLTKNHYLMFTKSPFFD